MRPSSPDLAASHAYRERDGVRLWVHRAWESALPVEALLAGAPPSAWGSPLRHDLRGRSEVFLVDTPRGPLLAKALSRGGAVGGFLRHWYADPARPAREAWLSEELRRRGCPTPEVVVARARRSAPGLWRLELATAFVPDAHDLLAALRAAGCDGSARTALARAVGRTLRRLHDEGLRHRDLQVKNLLVPPGLGSDGLLVVIDLDRCRLGMPLRPGERLASLARFTRSLVRRGLLPGAGTGGRPGAGPDGSEAAEVARGEMASLVGVRAFLAAYGRVEGLGRAALARAVARRVALRLGGPA